MNKSRLEQLKSFLEGSPEDSFLLFALGKEYESLNEQENALYFYRKLENIDPNYIGLYYHLGKLEEKAGALAQAKATYLRGIGIAEKLGDRHALGELNEAFWALEDFMES